MVNSYRIYRLYSYSETPAEEPKVLPIKWLTDKPVWVEKWPMTCEKLEALEKLVQEQLNAGDIEDITSYLSLYHSSF